MRSNNTLTGFGIEASRGVPYHRVLKGRGIAAALLGQAMQHTRTLDILEPAQSLHQFAHIIAVHRTEIADAEGLEHISSVIHYESGLEVAYHHLHMLSGLLVSQPVPYSILETVIAAAGCDAKQMLVHPAYRPVY